ncbi:uncharacterized protein HGUI_00385 [Hanseniaspora guilliermondii]|uniref:Uncharacterized protein n=1 Tax=Hanseniaspora guilliermondii TaxID=56406 RepID=A0A1L0CIP3_9ASCO|nr:uncharacterized protein HGUI_00385 [Hanseniaspora guilliermondii]
MSILNEKDHNVISNVKKKRSFNQLYKQTTTRKDGFDFNNIKKVKVNNTEDVLKNNNDSVIGAEINKDEELLKISIPDLEDVDNDFFDIGPELTSTPTRKQNIFLEPETSDFSTGNDSYDESVILPMNNFNHTFKIGLPLRNTKTTRGEYLNEVRELTPYTKFLCDEQDVVNNIEMHESSSE